MDSFPEWIQSQLDQRGWKQADLARASGFDTAVISNVINQRRNAGEVVCRAIAKAFNLPPETVFRAAGLLPPINPQDEDTDRLLYRISQLTPEEQALVDGLIETLLTRREIRAKSHKQSPASDVP